MEWNGFYVTSRYNLIAFALAFALCYTLALQAQKAGTDRRHALLEFDVEVLQKALEVHIVFLIRRFNGWLALVAVPFDDAPQKILDHFNFAFESCSSELFRWVDDVFEIEGVWGEPTRQILHSAVEVHSSDAHDVDDDLD